MTYLEALEPELITNTAIPSVPGITSNHLSKGVYGAYANLVNADFHSFNFKSDNEDIDIIELHNVQPTIIEDSEQILVEEHIDATEITTEINATTEAEAPMEFEASESLLTIDNHPSNPPLGVDLPIYVVKKQGKSKKKKKLNKKSKATKFILNPVEERKEGFVDWLFHFKPIDGGNTAKLLKNKKKKISKVEEEIERSVQRGEDIVSENLAILYEKQKHYDLAIEMFQKLNLKYPEKSSYFAAKIIELKSKIKHD